MDEVLSTGEGRRLRKPPAERRAEIVDAAARVALDEGLECITLRRVADKLGVRPSTVGHYFPVVEEFVAETFGYVAEAELSALIPECDDASAKWQLAQFLSRALSPDYHDVNRLWINARHLARNRPLLRQRVIAQGDRWRERLTQILRNGCASGEFITNDPEVVALKILVVVDGLSADLNADPKFPPAVFDMIYDIAEVELGQPRGTLRSHALGPRQAI